MVQQTQFVPGAWGDYGSIDGALIGHDANGNVRLVGQTSYEHDATGRLTRVTTANDDLEIRYDPVGRLFEVAGTRVYRFVHFGSSIVEIRSAGVPVEQRAFLDGTLAHVAASGHDFEPIFDGTHAVAGLVAPSGKIEHTFVWSPYGRVLSMVPPPTGIGFRGGERLSVGDVELVGARAYLARLGQFLEPDPAGWSAGSDRYVYAAGAPTHYTDPSGLEPRPVDRTSDTATPRRITWREGLGAPDAGHPWKLYDNPLADLQVAVMSMDETPTDRVVGIVGGLAMSPAVALSDIGNIGDHLYQGAAHIFYGFHLLTHGEAGYGWAQLGLGLVSGSASLGEMGRLAQLPGRLISSSRVAMSSSAVPGKGGGIPTVAKPTVVTKAALDEAEETMIAKQAPIVRGKPQVTADPMHAPDSVALAGEFADQDVVVIDYNRTVRLATDGGSLANTRPDVILTFNYGSSRSFLLAERMSRTDSGVRTAMRNMLAMRSLGSRSEGVVIIGASYRQTDEILAKLVRGSLVPAK